MSAARIRRAAASGELPGQKKPFEIPERTVIDIYQRRLTQEFRKGGVSMFGDQAVQALVDKLVQIATGEIDAIRAAQIESPGELDPKKLGELVKAIADLGELVKGAARKSSAPQGAAKNGADTDKPDYSPTVKSALERMKEGGGASP